MLIGNQCQANTFPYIDNSQRQAIVEHEASTCKLSEEQLFYLESKGLTREKCISMVVSGFCHEVFKQLPLEFSVEAVKLLELKLTHSVG
jgi:Fe-S cluster assembly protein SufB